MPVPYIDNNNKRYGASQFANIHLPMAMSNASLPQKMWLSKYGDITILPWTNHGGNSRVSRYVLKLSLGMVMPKNDYMGNYFQLQPLNFGNFINVRVPQGRKRAKSAIFRP